MEQNLALEEAEAGWEAAPPTPHPTLISANPVSVLRLIRSENVGPVTFFQLLKYAGSVEEAVDAIPDLAARGGRKKNITLCSEEDAALEYERLTRFGAEVVLYGSPFYPHHLLQIDDPPPLLTVNGKKEILTTPQPLAIVGARNASANGCQFAYRLAQDLAHAGWIIVSGLARGIDTAAHKGSLQQGTVAAIAGGIDNVYPQENEKLYREIIETGAVITEQPFGSAPQSRSFPGRNRIISGMSRGVAVVEATLKSGSLITARFALEQGREVYAVPGSPLDPRSHGTNMLIRDGATLIQNAQDVLSELAQSRANRLMERQNAPYFPPPITDLSHARVEILKKLGYAPVATDELIAQSGIPASAVQAVLLELELAGRLTRQPGGRVSLTPAEE